MWIVKLVKSPRNILVYASDYFPRKFKYKKDALALQNRVEAVDGVAVVEKV